MDQSRISFIAGALRAGKTREQVYAELLKAGWTLPAIEEHFAAAVKSLADGGPGAFSQPVPHPETTLEERQGKIVQIIVNIGAILIGAGIIAFVAGNWAEMGRGLKISLILATMLASYAAGYYLLEKTDKKRSGAALVFLGTVVYGAGIFLVGQMFNIRGYWPEAFMLWMLGALAVAYALDLGIIYVLAGIVGVVAASSSPAHEFDILFSSRPGAVTVSGLLLLACAGATLFIAYHSRSRMPAEEKASF